MTIRSQLEATEIAEKLYTDIIQNIVAMTLQSLLFQTEEEINIRE